jgi:hypoxanthine phosphoribosyltransferase
MEKQYLSYSDIHQMCKLLSFKVTASNWMPHVIVGVSRGGMLPATLLSNMWNLPVKAFNLSLRDNTQWEPDRADWIVHMVQAGKHILVVDDINDSGATVNWIRTDWQSRLSHVDEIFSDHVKFAVLLNKQTSTTQVDYQARHIEPAHSDIWWVFPWENMES